MAPRDKDNGATRDRLAAVLAAYGADPSRWPEGDRVLASRLAASEPTLLAALDEARITDAALARASQPVPPKQAAQRLIARVTGAPGEIVSFARHAHERQRPMQAVLPGRLAVMSALAASLALGLYLGASGHGDWLIPPLVADDTPEYLAAELDVLDGTLQLFEDHMEP